MCWTLMVPGSFTVDPLQAKAEFNISKKYKKRELERGGGRVRKELETTEGTPSSKEKEEEGEEVLHDRYPCSP